MRVSKKKQKGFTLVELLVVVAILAVLAAILLPRFLGYTDKAREAQTMKDIRSMCTVVEAFTATDGNYPEASLDIDNPRSIASVMQSKGIKWTGDDNGVVDPWNNPYYYDLTEDYYCIASPGKDGILNTADDICNIGKISKKASGLDGNAIPSAVPGNNPGNGNEEHLSEVPDGYIGIRTPGELASIGVQEGFPLDGDYIVMANISLSGYVNWVPIGDEASPFTGTFDGNNYIISNLTINSDGDFKGLFGCISETSEITNLGLENANIDVARGICVGGLVGDSNGTITDCYTTGKVTGDFYTGGLVGLNNGSIKNCYATGEVTGDYGTGGLVGQNNNGTITDCYATGEVTGNNDRTGGLVGENYGTITDCYATGEVTSDSEAGGLVGRNAGSITNSYATGSVEGNNYTGGLVGYSNYGSITNSYATGSISGDNCTGGLMGSNSGTITDCYATGEVTGDFSIGGLMGSNSGTITNCYATGNITGNNLTGGLVGYNQKGSITNCYATGKVTGDLNTIGGLVGSNLEGTLTNCYATGEVKGGSNTGGLVGCNYGSITDCYATGSVEGSDDTGGLVGKSNGTIENSYYNSETTSQSDNNGKGTPLTTAEMKNSTNFTDWDFDTVWGIDQGNSYPYLIGNEQIPHPGT